MLVIKEEIKKEVDSILASGGKAPHLAAVIVGEDGASLTYVGSKVRSCKQVGFDSTLIKLPENISENLLIDEICKLNNDKLIDGFIVQLPLPPQIDEEKILLAVDPKKDVDGFHPVNVGNLSSGYESNVPCTPLGCFLLLKEVEKNLSGKNAPTLLRLLTPMQPSHSH